MPISHEAQIQQLVVDRSLLNPRFEGFKLKSTDSLVGDTCSATLPEPVKLQTKAPSTSSMPFKKLQDRGRYNHLFSDVRGSGMFYFDANNTVWHIEFSESKSSFVKALVLDSVMTSDCSTLEYPSIHSLISPNCGSDGSSSVVQDDCLFLLHDGAGALSLVRFDEATRTFTNVSRLPDFHQIRPFTISSCHLHPNTGKLSILIYTSHQEEQRVVDRNNVEQIRLKTVFDLQLVGIDMNGNRQQHVVECILRGACAPYQTFVYSDSFIVVSEFLFEELKSQPREHTQPSPVLANITNNNHNGLSGSLLSSLNYIWGQDEDDVTIHFDVSNINITSASDLNVRFANRSIKVEIRSTPTMILSFDDILCNLISTSDCIWTLEQEPRLLTLHLQKAKCGVVWPFVYRGDESRQVVEAGEMGNKLQEMLPPSSTMPTTTTTTTTPSTEPPSVSTSDLEVEDLEGESVCFVRYSSLNGKPTHINLASNHEWIGFGIENGRRNNYSPSFILKNDVDGLICSLSTSPSTNQGIITHTGSIPAFGYVKNSKRERKFVFHIPGYAVICETYRYLYLYKRDEGLVSQSDQLIIDLSGDDGGGAKNEEVLGIHYYDGLLFILKDSSLIAVRIKN